MDQSRAINALAPFVALAKSATSPRAAADLVTQATSAPNTYVFAELLQQPNIQNLTSSDQYGSFHTLLQCFAWGTWETYKNTSGLPQLSDSQALKLRLLSLLSIAAEKPSTTPGSSPPSNLSYPALQRRLDLPSALDLEHLVTTAVYRELLTATLNPATQTVVVTSTAPLRDIAPGQVTAAVAELDAWRARADAVLAGLDAEISRVHAAAARRVRRDAAADKQARAAMDAFAANTPTTTATAGPLGPAKGAGNARQPSLKQRAADPSELAAANEEDLDDLMEVDASSASAAAAAGRKRGSGAGPSGASASSSLLSRFAKGAGR